MAPSILAALAGLQGLAESLPISASGHGVLARLWVGVEPGDTPLDAVLQLGTLVALALVVRNRLRAAASETVRAIARPQLFRTSPAAQDGAALAAGALASLTTSMATARFVTGWGEAPFAVGLGLLLTAVALASTAAAPRGRLETPSLAAALVVGVAHGLALMPGASRVGAALTLLLWLGVRPSRAVDFAFAITLPGLALTAASGITRLHGATAYICQAPIAGAWYKGSSPVNTQFGCIGFADARYNMSWANRGRQPIRSKACYQ